MFKSVLIGMLCGAMLLTQGCATLVTSGNARPVRVETTPPGASVYLNDDFKGKTPLTLEVARRDRHRLRVEQEGYETFSRQIKPAFNGWFLGNILFGGIIGVVVDVASGSIVTPSPGKVRLTMLPPGGNYEDKAQVQAAREAAEKQEKADKAAAKAAKSKRKS